MQKVMFALTSIFVLPGLVFAQGNWVAFTSNAAGMPPIVEVLESTNLRTVIHVTIPGMWVEDTLINGTIYQILKIPNYGTMYNVGAPQLPAIRELVAIPPISNANISVISTATPLILNGYVVYPYQAPVPEGQPPCPFTIDTILYATNVFYPTSATALSDPAVWRDVRVVQPALYSITFNPVTQQLNVCYECTIMLYYWGVSNTNILLGGYPAGVGPDYATMYRSQIINYDWLGIQEDERYSSYAYLVITTEQYADAIEPFVFWKAKKGFEVEAEIVAAGLDPEDIKRIIKTDYDERHTEWVLLVGDHADIQLKNIGSPIYSRSDYWYSLITGADHYPELAIGRFSPSNTTDVATMTNKTFAYERNPCANWDIDRILLVVCWNCLDSYACKQHIRRYVMAPINFTVDTAYAMDTLGIYCYASNETVKDYMQEDGGVSIVNYRGHGYWDAWGEQSVHGWSSENEYFTNTDVRSLNNYWYQDSAWLPLVFNFCCMTGNIPYPECMTEAWTRSPNGGAAGALGATYLTSSLVSNPMDTILFETMFSTTTVTSPMYAVGKAMNYAKVWVINNPPSGATMDEILQVVYRQLWVGDPSLEVWTDSTGDLASLAVTHPTSISTQPTEFTVSVTDSTIPVPGALVCLYKGSDIHERGFTDADGQITFYIDPATEGTLYVTVTNHHDRYDYFYNYRPYEGTCRVLSLPGGPMSSDHSPTIPTFYALGVACPSPFERLTEIRYQIPDTGSEPWICLKVHDVTGRLVRTLVNEPQGPGYYRVLWDGTDDLGKTISSGIYFYRFEGGDFTAVKKMVMLR